MAHSDDELATLDEEDQLEEDGEEDFGEEDEEDLLLAGDESEALALQPTTKNHHQHPSGGGDLKCTACDFTTRSRLTLQRHERVAHLKKKFFRCVKCNYVTHVKARYTKHVKYHSMPMIKCDLCEFRTPYKWNLDRHLKNHMGGGMYQCSLCNFTAHIKQSLTVHIQNHHLSPEKARSARRRNKVGASDQLNQDDDLIIGTSTPAVTALPPPSSLLDADEMELLRLERDETTPPPLPTAKGRGIKCHLCSFRTASDSELAKHLSKAHPPPTAVKRPVPNLIPISNPPPAPPTILKIPQIISSSEWIADEETQIKPTKKKIGFGFLDQLAQKLASSKEATSTVASSSVISGTSTASVGWSSRCQHCRQRCKTRADLLSHLKICSMAIEASASSPAVVKQQQPHPMENKVFVWNDPASSAITEETEETAAEADAIMMMMMMEAEAENKSKSSRASIIRPSSVAGSDISEASLMGVETAPGIGAVTGGTGHNQPPMTATRRVYRCPQCSFWATTASRFHVHMVGHTNTKPFECSQCAYRSNWRWDITKHIKLKAARDPQHSHARVLLLDASGERHYDQYDRYLVMMRVTESAGGGPALTHGRLAQSEASNVQQSSPSPSPSPPVNIPSSPLPPSTEPYNLSSSSSTLRQLPALNAIAQQQEVTVPAASAVPRRTIWKCKRCTFKHKDKRMVLAHMAKHTRRDNFSCGLCGKGSNWQSVIRRHCRLKHNGNIQVIENRVTDDDGPELSRESITTNDLITPPPAKRSKGLASRAASPTEDSMGYMMHPDKQQYSCSNCPFVCKSLTDIETHRQNHKASISRAVKCTFCNYYVTDKQELSQHLLLHGLHDLKLDSSGHLLSSLTDTIEDSSSTAAGAKRFRCSSCPYVSDSKNQYVYHKQFHRPRGAPYRCPQCSYNVSRRHLLNQHLKVHGLPPVRGDEDASALAQLMASGNQLNNEFILTMEDQQEDVIDDQSSEEPEINESIIQQPTDGYTHLGIDPDRMTKLTDSATINLPDIPLTWVSRGLKFYKMFKCRFCPHVNVRKANIQEHEKRHQAAATDVANMPHACGMCNYRCNNAGVLSAHVKVHSNVLGVVHALADASQSDEQQLRNLAGLSPPVGEESSSSSSSSALLQPKLELLLGKSNAADEEEQTTKKALHFCDNCPARFLVETELVIHQRFHGLKLAFACDVCTYTARQENHLLAHWKVHSREYQERTKVLLELHGASEKHPQPRILAVQAGDVVSGADDDDDLVIEDYVLQQPEDGDAESIIDQEEEESAIDLTRKSLIIEEEMVTCPQCPAKFERESKALIYHATLHGSDAPFRCRHCNYAVKAKDNLMKHEKLHKIGSPPSAGAAARSWQCSKCPTHFEKKEQFKAHMSLHGSQERYRCDRCDYAAKHHANYLQHVKKHDDHELLHSGLPQHPATAAPSTTADRQHIWLQEKLIEQLHPSAAVEVTVACQYCPFRCRTSEELSAHTANHAVVNGRTAAAGGYRCNFCDYTAAEQHQLPDHIRLHFQLKNSGGELKSHSKSPESYWKCSNLEIWSEPVLPPTAAAADESFQQQRIVYEEKNIKLMKTADEEDEDEDALYIDLSTGQPIKDDDPPVIILPSADTAITNENN